MRPLRWSLLCLLCVLLAGLGCNLLPLRDGTPEVTVKERAVAAPSKDSYRMPPYVFIADFTINRNLPVFRELGVLRDQIAKDLELPYSTKLVHVYLFEVEADYKKYMKKQYPDLPPRRAFFVAQPRPFGGAEDLFVYTYWGEQIQQDLRHELTHALLHSVLKDVPLWLDEGLAEYYETPRGWSGVNFKHLNLLRRPGDPPYVPNLARLEQLTDVNQMNQLEYAESWAWVHLMMRGNPDARKVLTRYLHELRTTSNPGALKPRLERVMAKLNDAFTQHLAELESIRPPTAATAEKR